MSETCAEFVKACGSKMKILFIVMDTCEIKKILRIERPEYPVKTNKAPPGLDKSDRMYERICLMTDILSGCYFQRLHE
jgi:hypothetical protein